MHPDRPDTLYMQKHWDVMRSDDGGDHWHEISGNLPTDFGFPIAVHAHEPETVYVVPITSDSHHFPPEGKLRVYRSRTGGNEWEPLTDGLPQENCYVDILRDAMAVDTLDECGVYFGTTGGQVYASADAGDTWAPIVRDLPPVLSVEVQTLTCARSGSCCRRTCVSSAQMRREVTVEAEPTQRGVIDALEAQYPGLRGTLREPGTDRRRSFVRFYACEEDLSHEPADAPLPAAVADGSEPFLIIGAMAGG